jgi:hypothetical protein
MAARGYGADAQHHDRRRHEFERINESSLRFDRYPMSLGVHILETP